MTSTLPKLPTLPTIPEILDKVSDVTDSLTARLPEVKLPNIDLRRIPGADAVKRIPSLFSIDLTDLDVRRLAESPVATVAKRAAEEVKEVAYTAVGFGVLAVQKAQVRRHEFFEARRTGEPVTTAPTAAGNKPAAKTTAKPTAETTSQSTAQDIATSNTEPEPA